MVNLKIRKMQKSDWVLWKDIRLLSLKLNPSSFAGDYDEEKNNSSADFQAELEKSTIFGAFVENSLVGVIGFYSLKQKKLSHVGHLFGVYVKENFRGKRIADHLLKAVILYAKETGKIWQICCNVVTTNESAKKLYLKHGFTVYGLEQRALFVNGKFYDEDLMVLRFPLPI